jgi:integrase
VKGMKRVLRKPTVPQLPFWKSHIRSFMRFSRGSYWHWRAAVVMAICFADFLRFSKALNIRLEHIMKAGNDLRFCVQKAKNHRLGFDVCLPVDDPKSIGVFVLDFL